MDNSGKSKKEEESEKKSDKTSKPTRTLFGFITLSGIAAAVTTYSHFFGYSFIKGKLAAIGYGNASISPSLDESLYQLADALILFVSSFFTNGFTWETFYQALLFGAITFFLILVFGYRRVIKNILGSFQKDGNNQNYLGKFKGFWLAVIGFFFGAAIPYLGIIFVTFILSVSWLMLSIGGMLGAKYISLQIDDGVCKNTVEVDWKKYPGNYTLGCVQINTGKNNSKPLYGNIIFSDKEKTYFLTSDTAFELDKNRKILSSVAIRKRLVKETSSVNTK